MGSRILFVFLLFLVGCASKPVAEKAAAPVENPIWKVWQQGHVQEVRKYVEGKTSRSDEDHHLLLLADHVEGKYDSAHQQFLLISKSYPRYKDTLRAALESLIHRGRYSEALEVVKANDFRQQWYTPILESLTQNPIQLQTKSSVTLPFTKGSSLDPYMPAIRGKIKSRSGKIYSGSIRIDTGAEYLALSKARADELGIESISCQQGKQAENKTQVCWAQVDLSFGKIEGKNIPVSIIYSLPDKFEPIMGTNIFQRFTTELNYPRGKIVFHPKDKKISSLKGNCIETPFYMWADHFMFAKGHIGNQKNLNFFIDTGLVAVAKDMRQAAIKIATEDLNSWGLPPTDKIFDPKADLGLGELSQSGHLVIHSPLANVDSNFGGVRIHGLLGHAWYKKYLWQIDFNSMKYTFCQYR